MTFTTYGQEHPFKPIYAPTQARSNCVYAVSRTVCWFLFFISSVLSHLRYDVELKVVLKWRSACFLLSVQVTAMKNRAISKVWGFHPVILVTTGTVFNFSYFTFDQNISWIYESSTPNMTILVTENCFCNGLKHDSCVLSSRFSNWHS